MCDVIIRRFVLKLLKDWMRGSSTENSKYSIEWEHAQVSLGKNFAVGLLCIRHAVADIRAGFTCFRLKEGNNLPEMLLCSGKNQVTQQVSQLDTFQ